MFGVDSTKKCMVEYMEALFQLDQLITKGDVQVETFRLMVDRHNERKERIPEVIQEQLVMAKTQCIIRWVARNKQ